MSNQFSKPSTGDLVTSTTLPNLGVVLVKEKGLAKGKDEVKAKVEVRVEAEGKVEEREKGSVSPKDNKGSGAILARRLSPYLVSGDRIGSAATSRQSGKSTG